MEFLPPYGVHGTLGMRTDEIQAHADEYRRLLVAFRDGQVDLESARTAQRLNADLDSIIRRGEA
jgi:glutathione-regulated potassium-efflux system ancillary protein KefG